MLDFNFGYHHISFVIGVPSFAIDVPLQWHQSNAPAEMAMKCRRVPVVEHLQIVDY